MDKPILYKPVTVLKGTDFAFTMNLEVAISTYDNILCVVYQSGNEEEILSKLCMVAETGYDVGITSVDTNTVLITVPAADTEDGAESFYSVEIALMDSDVKKVGTIVADLFEIKTSKI